MKFIDLKPLNIQRLKAYRKSILAKISGFVHCNCGSSGCDYKKTLSENNPNYINLKQVLDRVNKELARKQTGEREALRNSADVITIAEENRLRGRCKSRR